MVGAMVPHQNPLQQTLPAVNSISNSMLDIKANYEAARETKFLHPPDDMPRWGVGADYHTRIESEFWYLLEFARHVERDDPVVPQGVARMACNVVQDGYVLKPETGVDRIDRILKERWLNWTADDNRAGVDFTMKHNWNDIERLSVRRMVFDGDVAVNPVEDGRLQILEAHRIRTPLFRFGRQIRKRRFVVHGVEKNRRDQVVRYWITPEETGFGFPMRSSFDEFKNLRGVMAWQFDEMTGRNEPGFYHLHLANRFSQTRGITPLAPVLNTIGMHGDVQFAKLVQQQMASYVAFIHNIPFQVAGENYEPPTPTETICPRTGKPINTQPDLSPGAEYWSYVPGDQLQAFSPNIPNAEFFDHAKLLLTFISLNINMPLILFLLDASETNFSGWRGATDMAKLQFKEFQRAHSTRLHRPAYRWQIRRWMRQDRLLRSFFQINGEDLFRHSWQFPTWPYVEPLKDVQADAAEIASNLNSPRRVAARRKLDYEDIIRESCEDRSMLIQCAIDRAAALNEHPYIVANPDERVTWREISHPVMPDGLQMQILDKNDASSEERSSQSPSQAGGTSA